MLKSALLLAAGIIIGGSGVSAIVAANADIILDKAKAATLPVYTVYEANVTDEAAYAKALPDAQKIIKDNSGVYIAGGFNKAKLISGKQAVGNRYVVIKWDSEEAFAKAEPGIKTWLEKNQPDHRQIMAQGIE